MFFAMRRVWALMGLIVMTWPAFGAGQLVVDAQTLDTNVGNQLVLLPDGGVISLAEMRLAARQTFARPGDALVIDADSLRVSVRDEVSNTFLLVDEPEQRLVLASPNFQFPDPGDRVARFVPGGDTFFPVPTGTPYDDVILDDPGALLWVGPLIQSYEGQLPTDNPFMIDSDDDDVPDVADNCLFVANGPADAPTAGPSQLDTNGDGYGNRCDADLNNDCVVNAIDLGLLRTEFFSTGALDQDFNGDGVVNAIDLGLLRLQFFGTPGPSAFGDCP
ncbi:MAG: dockerin type I domain-containing protein [Pseudomonadota bacterium]